MSNLILSLFNLNILEKTCRPHLLQAVHKLCLILVFIKLRSVFALCALHLSSIVLVLFSTLIQMHCCIVFAGVLIECDESIMLFVTL